MNFGRQFKIFISLFTLVISLLWFFDYLAKSQTLTPVRSPQTGTCECPYDKTTAGRSCGGNSSYSKAGGTSRPVCYLEDQPQPSVSPTPSPSPSSTPVPSETPSPTPSPTVNPSASPEPSPLASPQGTSIHLKYGNPSNATSKVEDADNYLMVKSEYALSYNKSKGIPNWVSWQLNSSWLGDAPRQDDFRPDSSLPAGWYRVTPNDYTNSGFDRGHMTSSEDRGVSIPANSATFLMTNILPQSPDNNRGPWAIFESYCRDLIKQGKELYIVSGGFGEGGTGEKGLLTVVGGGKAVVPAFTWKVALVLDSPGAEVTESTRTIAIMMPNIQGIRLKKWQEYRVSIDDVEKIGYNFFSEIPENIQSIIEARTDSL